MPMLYVAAEFLIISIIINVQNFKDSIKMAIMLKSLYNDCDFVLQKYEKNQYKQT